MLEVPRVRDLINSTCIITHVNATDDGIPDLPALAGFRAHFKVNPWAHMNFGHFLIVTPDGEEILLGHWHQLQSGRAAQHHLRSRPGNEAHRVCQRASSALLGL